MGTFDTLKMRNFAQPPPELQETIESVAELVAERGPAIEFQLRSRDEGQRCFSFLYLDNEYAPFYQYKLGEARLRRKPMTHAIEAGKSNEASDPLSAYSPLPGASPYAVETKSIHGTKHNETPVRHNGADANLYQPPFPISSSDVYDPALLEPLTRDSHRDEARHAEFTRSTLSAPNTSIQTPVQPSDPQQVLESQGEDRSSTLHAVTPDGQNSTDNPDTSTTSQGIIPYGPLDEVHLLDSSGTERSGLNSFVVVSNLVDGEENDLLDYLNHSTELVFDREPIYRVRPNTSSTFRVPHHRLIPVGIKLGAEVKQLGNSEPGIVVKRTVERRKRLYNIKDAHGVVHEDVPEGMLRLNTGGTFDFRMPTKF